MNTLSAKNLTKSYAGRTVVNAISIEVDQSIVGILGPNGAGKTSTFYMMVGLTSPDKGDVYLNGKKITSAPLHQRARLGISYLPQEPSIFQRLTVTENIMAILELNPGLSKQARQDKTEALLDEFSITHIRNTKGISLSGGERRRVEIARALSTDPLFILLDEPFAGIDPLSVADIKTIIRQLQQKGIGILITDHNVRETLDICEKAYIFNVGEVIASGSPQEILANQAVRTAYLGDQFTLDQPQTTTNEET